MRKLFTFFVALMSVTVFSQEFAPIGAKWHYSQGTLNPNLETFKTIESKGDTLINGIDCRILIEVERITTDTTKTTYHYFSSRNDSVFFFKEDQFHLLYDFGAMPGDTITLGYYITHEQLPLTMIIDSLSTVEIDGHQRKVQHITSGDGMIIEFGKQVISGIGSTSFLFPTLDFSVDGPLRCYSDNDIGVFLNPFYSGTNWGGVDCEQIITTNVNVIVEPNKIKAYPNPANDMVTIMNLHEPTHYRIFNIFGQVKTIGALDQNHEIKLNNLSNGVYFIELNYNNQRKILKLIKE